MSEQRKRAFCPICRTDVEYRLQKEDYVKVIKGKEYTFSITVAICEGCGEEVSIPGLIDKNIQEVDEQYRAYEGIVSIEDIEKLMKIYNIGKGPLSVALGFGEVTVTRYLSGQIPSKEYSDIMKQALASPTYMKEKLIENKDKIAQSAFNKAKHAASQLESLFSVSDKMSSVIAYLFYAMEEVTPLTLQKMLYFVQAISLVILNREMFPEKCQAWVHGPVYRKVYDMFKDFKYNPIDDARFAMLEGKEKYLTAEERHVINLVVNTFGEYSGKVLERITHKEAPWQSARVGIADGIASNEVISTEEIAKYYNMQHERYDFSTEKGLRAYIDAVQIAAM